MNEEKTVMETQEEIDEFETAAMETAEEESAEELPESDDATENGTAEEGQEEGSEEEIDQPEEKDEFQHGENVRQPDNPEAKLAIAIDKSLEDTRIILENIQAKYASELFGIELVCYGSVYKFITKKDVYPYAQELFGASKQSTLSQAALETLAIIAYKQPITRVEIEELRGVSADVMLRKLQARNLIREAGRSEAVGRPILYEVTEEFMDSFKLYTLNELPDLPEYNKEDESENLFE